MKYFKIDGYVHAYEADGSQDAFIPSDAIPMTEAEVQAYLNPPITKGDLLAYAASKRYDKEVGGITVGGVFVATDDRSKVLLQGARTAADADPDHVEGWKTASGAWVDLDTSTIIALSDAVREHVSACFAIERNICYMIDDGEITTYEQINELFA